LRNEKYCRSMGVDAPRDARSMHLLRDAQGPLDGHVTYCVPNGCVKCCEFDSSLDSLTGNLGEATIHRIT